MTENKHPVVIIGSGPAGLTAAIYLARANLFPLLIHGPLAGGQLSTTTGVENFPGFEEGILGPDLMEIMRRQAARFGCGFLAEIVEHVSFASRPFEILTSSGNKLLAEALIVATGAAPRHLGVPGEKELLGFGVSTCATCDGAFFRQQKIAVVGGGDSACEEALFLTRFGSVVYLIHRRDSLRASKIMRERVLQSPKIEVRWNRQVKEIKGSREKGVESLSLRGTDTDAEEQLECAAVFVAIGHSPNSKLFQPDIATDQVGYILRAPNSTKTNIPGVFACGDVIDPVFRQAITAAGTGCMAAIECERWLEGTAASW
jgi:thioredoxin reductase (NADPH)